MLTGMFASRATGSVGPTDPDYASVTSLMHFDGSNGSTTITDQKGGTWTVSGTTEISTTQSKFGGSSLKISTLGISVLMSTGKFNFGTGDFTLEAWVRPTGVATYQTVFSSRSGSGGTQGLTFRISSAGKLQAFYGAGTSQITGTTTLTAGAFQHVALCRNGGTWRLFLNGTQDASGAISGDVSAGVTASTGYIGDYRGFAPGTEQFVGYIDDFRSTTVARYTSNFSPPTAAFPDA